MRLLRRLGLGRRFLSVMLAMGILFFGNVAFAEQQTLVILGASGQPGTTDPYTEFSLDGGTTWSQAYLYGWHPWGFVPGTNSWINCEPNGNLCLDSTVLYRVRFNIPEGATNPQMIFDVKADNYATIWLNGAYVAFIEGQGGTTADTTIAGVVRTGMNEILLAVQDVGGWAGFNYKITLNIEADAPPTTVPGGGDTVAPQVMAPAALMVESNVAGGGISAGDAAIQGWLAQATATDDVDGAVAVTNNGPAFYPMGLTTVTFTATDSAGNSSSATADIVVRDTTAPQLMVPGDMTVEGNAAGGYADGAAMNAWLAGATAMDIVDGPVTVTHNAPAFYGLGETTVTFTATDSTGNVATGTATVTVTDTSAPVISKLTASPNQLWSPNHKMVDVAVTVDASDVCDAGAACRIVSVSSNEPVNGKGDGKTQPDWVITGDLTLSLRAERSGKGQGRVYTITVACTDASGNSSTKTVTATVAHDQGKK